MKYTGRAAALVMSAALAFSSVLPAAVFADPAMSTGKTWSVTFGKDKKMHETYNAEEYIDQIATMQPGDKALFTVNLTTEYPDTATWSMRNDVIYSLEEKSPHGAERGAYDYKLTYTAPGAAQATVLYDSTEVQKDENGDVIIAPIGGENASTGAEVDAGGVGLHAATDELRTNDYFVLGNIEEGKTGVINLEVSLDGETQGNAYQDTVADLKMQFGVELPSETTTVNRVRRTVTVTPNTATRTTGTGSYVNPAKTGDESNLLMYSVAALVSGVILVILGIVMVRRKKASGKGGQE